MNTPHSAVAPVARLGREEKRVIALSSFGGALEFYDFIVYGVFAQYISAAFFPADNAIVSLVSTFAFFAIGYFVRPLGGFVLSRFGRRNIFLLSLLVMSVATIAMGLMPTYATAGVTATLLFVALRLVQGFCLGGEIAGAVTYVVEAAPHRAGLACGILFCLSGMGVVLASGVSAAVHAILPAADAAAYGWRAAFLLGGILGLLGFWIRGSLEESPAFAGIRNHVHRAPAGVVLRDYWRPLLIAMGVVAAVGALNGLLFVHMPAHLTRVLDYGPRTVANATMLSVTVLSVLVVVVGWLSDSIPRRWLHRTGTMIFIAGAWPAYQAIAQHAVDPTVIFIVIGACGALMNGTFGVIAADLFPTRVRFTGVALSYNVSMAIFQGLTPLAATLLIGATGLPAAPGLWMAGVAALSLLFGLWLKRFDGQILRQSDATIGSLAPTSKATLAPTTAG
ncbi:MAG TPA: MFS transporter [Vineibacter sp.]|nr:MFS transporter [Vineibacter sp.]